MNKTLYHDYLCLVALNTNQIQLTKIPKKSTGSLETPQAQGISSHGNEKCADRPIQIVSDAVRNVR